MIEETNRAKQIFYSKGHLTKDYVFKIKKIFSEAKK